MEVLNTEIESSKTTKMQGSLSDVFLQSFDMEDVLSTGNPLIQSSEKNAVWLDGRNKNPFKPTIENMQRLKEKVSILSRHPYQFSSELLRMVSLP